MTTGFVVFVLLAATAVCAMCVAAMAAGMKALMPPPIPDFSSYTTHSAAADAIQNEVDAYKARQNMSAAMQSAVSHHHSGGVE